MQPSPYLALCILLGAALSCPAHALTASVEVKRGVPRLIVNGRVAAPMLLYHAGFSTAGPLVVDVGPQWRQFQFSFVAPCSDDIVAFHVRNIAGKGSWWVDSAEFFEGAPDKPQGPNLMRDGGFEAGEESLQKNWRFFVTPVAGAKATCALDRDNPASGRACFRADVTHPGSASWHVHLYQPGHRIESGKRYTFRVKLRADRGCQLEIQAVHQAPPWTAYGGRLSAAAAQIEMSRDAGFHIRTFAMGLPWPRGDQPPDYSPVDAEIERHLRLDPDALIIPRIHTDAPQWWKQERPDHVMLYDYGRRRMASVASEPWRRDAEQALRLLVRHLEAKFGAHVLGYHVCGQSAGEWFYDWVWTKIMPNFETPFRDGFRGWLRGKYHTPQALRVAWNDPQAEFASVELPTLQERTEAKLGSFRDPKTQRRAIDFFEYNQVAIVEPMEMFCRAVKEECHGSKLVVAFYSYLFDVAGFAYGPQVSGHLLTDRVLRCPHIDALASPISYFDRQAGGSGPFMSPVDSIQLHGKLWIIEDDTRTYLSPPKSGFGRVSTPEGTRWVHQRNFAHLLAHRCGIWWMDLGGTGWLAGRDIWDNCARLRALWAKLDAEAGPLRPDVAVIVDETSSLYLPCGNGLTRPLMYYMRRQINRTGASVGHYLLSDLCAGLVPDAKLYVFLNAFAVSPEQRKAIHKAVRRDDKWALWLYAPGHVDPTGRLGDMEGLTGLSLVPAAPGAAIIKVRPDTFVARGVQQDQLAFGDAKPIPTRFRGRGDTPGVEVLGHYQGGDVPAFVLRRGHEWTSVFLGSTTISTGCLRELARAAGCHIWCNTDDVLIAGGSLVALHASTEGAKELLPPASVVLHDAATNATHPRGPVRLHLQQGETKTFLAAP